MLLSWGWNQNSQLGLGDSEPRVYPQLVDSPPLIQVQCGSRFTVGLSKQGNVYTWGRGDDGQLGHAKGSALAKVPRMIGSLEGVTIVSIAARGAHTLALSQNGHVYAWGRNDEGQLGLGHRINTKVPTLVQSLVDQEVFVDKIACGRVHSVVVSSQGHCYSWGCGEDGATGLETDEAVLVPQRMQNLTNVSEIACGSRHTLILVEQQSPTQRYLRNQLYACGWNTYGQLGLNDRKTRYEPTPIVFPQPVRTTHRLRITQIACGYRHSLAVLQAGETELEMSEEDFSALWAWGWNLFGQLGVETEDAPYAMKPVFVNSLPFSCVGIAGGGRHTVAIVERPNDHAKRMYSWGRNEDGQLGVGQTFLSTSIPQRCRFFGKDSLHVAAGWSHTCALVQSGGPSDDDDGKMSRKMSKSTLNMSRSPSTNFLTEQERRNKLGEMDVKQQGFINTVKEFSSGLMTYGNLDAGFAQFLNTLILTLNILSTLRLRVGLNQSLVVGQVVPGATLTVFISNFVLGAWSDVKTKQSNREHTALPHGVSTVLFFAFTMLIMAPVFERTGDAELAYHTGLGACFILGVLELICLFMVDKIRKVVPRAAMMSAIAGVSLTFIAMTFTVQIFSNPAVGVIPLIVILLSYGSNVQLPYRIPAGLMALMLGAAIVFGANLLNIELTDPASVPPKSQDDSLSNGPSFYLPTCTLPEVLVSLFNNETWQSLSVVIPMLIVNIVNNLSCLEAATSVGDEYETFNAMALDAIFTIIGSLFGNPFPTCVYIGHSAFKSMNASGGYSYLAAIGVIILGVTNGATFIMEYVPEVAGVGILMWIGIICTASAFERDDEYQEEASSTRSHAAAVALGLLPALAAWCLQYIQAVLPACGIVLSSLGPSEVHVPFDQVMQQLEGSGVYVFGLISLSRGYLLSSIFLSSALVEIIDRQFFNAAMWMVFAAVMSFVGAVHSFELTPHGISSNYGFPARMAGEFPLKYSFAYFGAAIMLFLFELKDQGENISYIGSYVRRMYRKWFRKSHQYNSTSSIHSTILSTHAKPSSPIVTKPKLQSYHLHSDEEEESTPLKKSNRIEGYGSNQQK